MDIEQYLRQFQVQGPEPALRQRVLATAAAQAGRRRWPWGVLYYGSAAAAVVLLTGLGWWLVAGRSERTGTTVAEPAAVAIFQGQGRLLPVTHETKFVVVDADRGRVRLDAGELYVEVPFNSQYRAEVQTTAGTAIGSGCPFLAHCSPAEQSPEGSLLAVASLGGKVEINNVHGVTSGGVGEIVLATAAAAPERHAEVEQSVAGCPCASALGLVYRPEVQAELRLTALQKSRLQEPSNEELRKMCKFFQGLRSIPRSDWAKRFAAFCAAQQQQLGAFLDPGQLRRLHQITLQQDGPFALARPEVADSLRLPLEQRTQLTVLLKQLGEDYRAVLKAKAGADIGKRLAEFQQRADRQIAGILTVEQLATWQALLGDKFAPAARPQYP